MWPNETLRRVAISVMIAAAWFGIASCTPKSQVITVRACIVEGARSPVGNNATLAADAVARASEIWQQGAIGFVTPPQTRHIPDPESALGKAGDIRIQNRSGFGSLENEALVNSCVDAWKDYAPNRQPGFTVVFIREFITDDELPLADAGISPDLSKAFNENRVGMCNKPYDVRTFDVYGRWSVIETVKDNLPKTAELVAATLAHELGHNLMLGHGDGVDQDGDGLWDEYCSSETAQSPPDILDLSKRNLMQKVSGASFGITSLQAERARAAADALTRVGLAN